MRILIVTLIALISFTTTFAQEEGISKNFGFGFQLGQYQNDFGIGVNLNSPYFAKVT